jgi:hypothetical protein
MSEAFRNDVKSASKQAVTAPGEAAILKQLFKLLLAQDLMGDELSIQEQAVGREGRG